MPSFWLVSYSLKGVDYFCLPDLWILPQSFQSLYTTPMSSMYDFRTERNPYVPTITILYSVGLLIGLIAVLYCVEKISSKPRLSPLNAYSQKVLGFS